MSEKPFSRLVNVRTLPKRGRRERFAADEHECAAVAERFDLIAVDSLTAEAEIRPWRAGGVRVTGHVSARMSQPCAITADLIDTSLDEPFEVLLVPETSALARPATDPGGEILLDPDGDDPPDTFAGDSIDLADIWLEHMALGIDPFARARGATFEASAKGSVDEEHPSPFAALAALKRD